ncbi:MAG: putative porin [Ferruginibacter sp.]
MKKLFFLLIGCFLIMNAWAQRTLIPGSVQNIGRSAQQGDAARKDTIGFEHRHDDSTAVTYRYLDSTRRNNYDSSINDFDNYYSVPSTYQYLGNNGAAATSLIFKPFDKPGWDPGFHSFDIYRFTLEETKFYKTTKPFSTLSYQLAGGREQMLKAGHTQSPRPNINLGFDYRLITAPGLFASQNNSHNNIRVFSNYQGLRKRYNGTLVLVANTIRASQNGGIKYDSSLADPNQKDRGAVNVNLGNTLNSGFYQNPFSVKVNTGNVNTDLTFFLRQSYDLGKRDSIAINDSTTEYLFYPKLRVQHTFTYSSFKYNYHDYLPDSTIYQNWYNINLKNGNDTFSIKERWSVISNDFSLLQFPDTKNTSQFFLAGATIQNIKYESDSSRNTFYNISLHGEYRNRTRNKLWDVLLKGEFYLNGLNSGDYGAYATLGRHFNKKLGDVVLFFSNVNRTPSFLFDNRSIFNLGNNNNYKKINITSFGATANNPFVQLAFTNYLITNYTYFTDYYHTDQYGKIINLLQITAAKKIRLTKRFNYYIDAAAQQTDPNAPVKVPLLFTRSRLAFEGTFYKNLNVSTGLEVRYYTPYKADNYSPLVGQFVPQDTVTIANRPDVTAYLNFRIKGFTAYIRVENLNTLNLTNGFDFTHNNFAAPHYPTQGEMIRFGIRWWFIN